MQVRRPLSSGYVLVRLFDSVCLAVNRRIFHTRWSEFSMHKYRNSYTYRFLTLHIFLIIHTRLYRKSSYMILSFDRSTFGHVQKHRSNSLRRDLKAYIFRVCCGRTQDEPMMKTKEKWYRRRCWHMELETRRAEATGDDAAMLEHEAGVLWYIRSLMRILPAVDPVRIDG